MALCTATNLTNPPKKMSDTYASDEDIPTFDFQFDLEEHFRNIPSSSGQIIDLRETAVPAAKKRFATLTCDDLDDLVENAQAKRTKYGTNWAISAFEGRFSIPEEVHIHDC